MLYTRIIAVLFFLGMAQAIRSKSCQNGWDEITYQHITTISGKTYVECLLQGTEKLSWTLSKNKCSELSSTLIVPKNPTPFIGT